MSADACPSDTLLAEIGTLELPARLLPGLARCFADCLWGGLAEDRWIGTGEKTLEAFYTPRRLAVRIPAVACVRSGLTRIQRGPTLAQAFDSVGQPRPAALGFARSLGVDLAALTIESDRLVYQVSEPPIRLEERLPALLEEALRKIPIDRQMRWASGTPPFVRPIRSILLLHGTRLVPGQVYGLATGRTAQGHPIHHPAPVTIAHPDEYESALRNAYVLLGRPEDPALRERIWSLVVESARNWRSEWHPVPSGATLQEVSALVEWPQAVAGGFPERFLKLPDPVIRAVLCGQQRVFPLADHTRHLAPGFVGVVNLASTDVNRVRAGMERVILPRLADALFFFEEDQLRPLADRARDLAGILFDKRLGHLGERRERLIRWVNHWSRPFGVDPALAEEAASLVLCDLTTSLVREYPELAGEAGAYYALAQGSPTGATQALREAYRPATAEDGLPETTLGRLLSLALRTDLLAGYFLIDEKPNGQRDPFGLRRAAQGIARILDHRSDPASHAQAPGPLPPLVDLFKTALAGYPASVHSGQPIDRLAAELYDFTLDRLRARYLEQGGKLDAFEAVAALRPETLGDFRARLDALVTLRPRPEFLTLAQMMKRVGHLLKKRPVDTPVPADTPPPLTLEPVEAALEAALAALESRVQTALARGHYRAALEDLLALEAPLAAFFDSVLILTEDRLLRQRRLALLERARDLLRSIADLERLQGGEIT